MEEFEIKVKDHQQNCMHVFTERADSLNEANQKALELLRNVLNHDEFEVVHCRLKYRKYTYGGDK